MKESSPKAGLVFTARAVLFDLDGTLVDSAPDLWGAMNHVLAKRGYPLLALEQVRHLMGDGARALLARGFWGKNAQPPQGDPAFEEAVTIFLSYYRQHLTDNSAPYPGAVQALQVLRNQGLALAVVTNKPEALARRMLEQLQLLPFFVDAHRAPGSMASACVVGGDTLAQRKPAAEPILHALAQLDLPPALALMVGDSLTDVGAARAAGCPVVWMSHGYGREGNLHLQPDERLDHFEHLPRIVRYDA